MGGGRLRRSDEKGEKDRVVGGKLAATGVREVRNAGFVAAVGEDFKEFGISVGRRVRGNLASRIEPTVEEGPDGALREFKSSQ